MAARDVVRLSATKVLNRRAFANTLGIPMGAVVHLLPSLSVVQQLEKSPPTCQRCGAFFSPFCTLQTQSGQWECNFCRFVNGSENGEDLAQTLQAVPELHGSVVDYVSSSQSPLTELQVVVFVLDLTFGSAQLTLVTQSIKQAVEQMDRTVMVGLVLVDACVSLCNLMAKSGLIDLHCLPGHTVKMPNSLRRPLEGYASCVCTLEKCLPTLQFILDTLCTTRADLPERERPRCLGTGVHEALNVIKELREMSEDPLVVTGSHSFGTTGSEQRRKEHIIVMTCGPPTRGPGSVPADFASDQPRFREAKNDSRVFFERLAEVAKGMQVKVDLYGISFSPIGLSLVESLPKATAGIVALHSVISPNLMGHQISESLDRTFGRQGIFDVRLSKGLRVSSIVGPVVKRLSPEESGDRKLTSNACLLKSVEIGRSLSFLVEATADFSHEDIYIQVYLSWRNQSDGRQIERTVTCQLTPTGNLQEFLKSIHGPTVGVLLAKKQVVECTEMMQKREKHKLELAREGLAYKLAFMVQKFGKLLESKTGFFGLRQQNTWACPQELWYVAQCLYHLHRGLLLVPPGSNAEEVDFLQTVFLSAPLELADRMMVPKLFRLETESLSLTQLPAITTAMDPRHVMLIDHGFYIFVWIGRRVGKDPTERVRTVASLVGACEAYAKEKCTKRGFMSELIVAEEGIDDMSIYNHLTPSHRDLSADQIAQGNSGLAAEKEEGHTVSYPNTKELSFYEWCRMVEAEPPKLNKEMKSLSLES